MCQGLDPNETQMCIIKMYVWTIPMWDEVAEWLNKKGYLSVRGKKFKGNHVHSIVKKKRLKDEKLDREYPEVWSDFSLEVVDKTLVNMFEGL